MTTTVGVIAAILCTGAIMAVVLLALLKVGSRQDGPDYGLALFREDSTEDDPMDAYLEERAAGNGVLPPEVPVKVPGKIHYKCADFQLDGEVEKVCPDCAPLLEGVKPVVTRG